MNATVLRTLDASQRQFFDWFRTSNLYDKYRCDNYVLITDDTRPDAEWMHAYWLRQFGFSRSDEMKGLAVIDVPFVVRP